MIKLSFSTLIIAILLFSFSCRSNKKQYSAAQNFLDNNKTFINEDVRQLLVVFNAFADDHLATLVAMERTENSWEPVYKSVPAVIGKNGFAAPGEKREGDGKSPVGLFKLGQLYTYEGQVDTQMPFTQSTPEDKWIDDPESPDYNRHVRGPTSANTYENLKLKSDHYKYCMVIRYNTDPVVKGKGSAIFLHLREQEDEATAGCIAISEPDMLQLLKWLDPKKHPMILMGTMQGLPNSLH